MESENPDSEKEAKKLRSSEPDLKVVIGTGADESILRYYSQTLAVKSKYIDAMLSAPMKEKEEYEISFPDIVPEVWDKMMSFLDDHVASRKMTSADALEVMLFYDKYEFVEGMKLCDQVLVDYFKSTSYMERKGTLDLDFIIHLINAALEANMKAAFKEGMRYIRRKMMSEETPYGKGMFTKDRLTTLLPLLRHSRDNRETMGLLVTFEEDYLGGGLERPDFAEAFVSRCEKELEHSLLAECISHIVVYGTGMSAADGDYFGGGKLYAKKYEEDEVPAIFQVLYLRDADYKGWAIVRQRRDQEGDEIVQEKGWIAPYSENYKFPPMKNWIPSDCPHPSRPIIKYILKKSLGD